MKKSINRKVYNTETAAEIRRKACGYFGDPTGYEEVLFQTAKGDYFVYALGGPQSKYAEETIFALTADEAGQF